MKAIFLEQIAIIASDLSDLKIAQIAQIASDLSDSQKSLAIVSDIAERFLSESLKNR